MKIVLHIERLVLDGVGLASGDRAAMARALATELSRLLSTGLHAEMVSGGAHAALTAPAVELGRGSAPAHLGRQIARAVHGGIGSAREPGGRLTTIQDVVHMPAGGRWPL